MRRRVAALLIVLVVVALLVWGLSAWARSGQSDADQETTAETTTSASEENTQSSAPATEPTVPAPGESTATVTTRVSASGTATDTATDTASETVAAESTVAAPARTGACELKDLIVTATPNQPSYKAGVEPVFYMEVKNPTDTECSIDLNDNLLRFEVYDMATNDRIWADTDCYPSVVTGTEKYAPGESQGYQARWSATASQPGQCSNRPAVGPGSYYLHAVIGDNASDAAPFNIT